ncbi:unnamed protein product [Acanthoscelides obtectus]|uniref:Double jelly roll-like domain-containing protein n=1 Tax=Acanthoscelides obtectus TaxID=200917 RepID=A0A9P0MKL8_ACAOB|nr:unnamed protein product [Acanthoscelides obtectus]CAK1627006.1 hypothetical protein AOBTE_LOCUS4214 [Acanthoscelides obtectus]
MGFGLRKHRTQQRQKRLNKMGKGLRKKSPKSQRSKRRLRILPLPKTGGFLPLLLPILGALGALGGGAASIAKAVNDAKANQSQLAEQKRHNLALEASRKVFTCCRMSILNVTQKPLVDNSITELEYHTYQPFINSNFDYNDEIRIAVQELDAYTIPSQSLLYLEGELTKADGTAVTTKKADGTTVTTLQLINNAFAFLFRELRYELNGVVVDSVRNVGLTSTLKGYLSFNEMRVHACKMLAGSQKTLLFLSLASSMFVFL